MNVIFTCGGTGGHINPAIAVANTFQERHPDSNILFLGVEQEMEEKLVPQAGYRLIALPGSGLSRGFTWKDIKFNARAVKFLLSAMKQVRGIIKEFNPDVIIGTGGYACFPALFVGIPSCVN